jgi:dephospho-CoA kinase
MYRVALTGNIASGKSAVAELWRRHGAALIDADVLAREAVAPGSPALARIAERFGEAVLDASGGLDRAALRGRVFADEDARRDLEAIVHPEVARLRAERERELEAAGEAVVVNVIPLLFEVGLEHEFDEVVLVDSPFEQRLARLTELRGLDAGEALQMIRAQAPAERKRAQASLTIDNDGTLDALEEKALRVWMEILERAAA